jgi:hypothetical protein
MLFRNPSAGTAADGQAKAEDLFFFQHSSNPNVVRSRYLF